MNLMIEHKEKIFPVALIAMSLSAAGFYFLCGDTGRESTGRLQPSLMFV